MSVIKRIFAALIFAVLLLVIASLFLSNEIKISKSTSINASSVKVHSLINDYKNWAKWSPWAEEQKENMKFSITGSPTGKGSVLNWELKDKDGKIIEAGNQTITKSTRALITYDLVITAPFQGKGSGTFVFDEKDGKTDLTWTYDSKVDMPIAGPYIAMLMVNPDLNEKFPKGLANIKALAEK